MRNKKVSLGIGYFVFSVMIISVFATRTSPLYSLLMGDYGGNNVSAAILIGKYWSNGSAIPYKDLFVTKGPLYFLIQAIGWILGERTGIFVLEIINLFLYLIVMHQVLKRIVSEKSAVLLNVFVVIPYIAMCAGGDSSGEWCLLFLALGFYLIFGKEDFSNKRLLLIGIVTGCVLVCDFRYGGLLYGLIFGMFICIFRGCNLKELLKAFFMWIVGLIIPIGVAVMYFACQGSLRDLCQGAIFFPFQWLISLTGDINVWVHKIVKNCLVLPIILAGVLKIYKKEYTVGIEMLCAGVVCFVFLIGGDNSWYFYMASIPAIPIGIATAVSEIKDRKIKIVLGMICSLLILSLSIIPFKDYIAALVEGVSEITVEFYEDLLEYQKNFENNDKELNCYFVETDSTYYLLMDMKPLERYFTEQLELSKYSGDIEKKVQNLMDGGTNADVLLVSENGYIGRDFEKYTLVQVYFIPRTDNLFVYIPNGILFESGE